MAMLLNADGEIPKGGRGVSAHALQVRFLSYVSPMLPGFNLQMGLYLISPFQISRFGKT